MEPDLPDIWKVVENSYDSDVMVTMSSLAPPTAFLVDELYDINDQEGVLKILEHGRTSKMNYYTNTDQSYVVVNGTECSFGNLIDHPGIKLWGWDYASSTKDGELDNFIFGPSALLRMVRDFSKQIEYIGVTKIRDIDADHWHLNHPSDHTVDYYFAVDDWNMPYGHKLEGIDLKAPLQVRVNGKESNPWNPDVGTTEQEIFYDYTDFRPYVLPEDFRVFEVDSGVSCEGRMTLDPQEVTPPRSPESFKVFVEVITNRTHSGDGAAKRSWMYYDNDRHVMRVDVDSDIIHRKAFKSVQDIGTGIEYHIADTGKCTMSTWSKEDFASMVGAEVADVIMPSTGRLFSLDDKYIFNGYSETRSIRTARWTATRNDITNPSKPGQTYNKVVVDYLFLTKYTDDTSEILSDIIPVRFDLTIYADNDPNVVQQVQTVNLLHMQTAFDVYEMNPFDVRECMDLPVERSWFKFTFRGQWDKGASQNQDEFQRQLMQKIFNGTEASYVRMAEVQLSHDEINVYATLLLLEPAPYSLQFLQLEDAKPSQYDTQLPKRINDVNACAAYCLTYKNFNCKSFYECSGQSKNCFVSNNVNPKPPSAHVPADCKHFKKATTTSDFQPNNVDVFLWLKNKMDSNSFNIKLTYDDLDGFEQTGIFRGKGIKNEIFADDPVFVDYIRDDFHISRSQAMLKIPLVQMTLKAIPYAECLVACDLALGFDCESFSYCYGSSTCYLSTYVAGVPADPNDIVEKYDCVIINRKYTDDYNSIEGTVYTSDAKLSIDGVSDDDKCAYLCDNSTDFTCRSFDYCLDTKICDLYTERSIDIPDEKLNHSIPFCNHYERDALVDFAKHPKQVLDGNRNRYVQDVTSSACAEICEQEPDFGCNGFDYCIDDSYTTCFLTEAHYSDDGVVIHNSPDCDHYSREYYDGKDRNAYAHTKKSVYKYGPGDMAGLGVSMLVITIGLTFSLVYVYNKSYRAY